MANNNNSNSDLWWEKTVQRYPVRYQLVPLKSMYPRGNGWVQNVSDKLQLGRALSRGEYYLVKLVQAALALEGEKSPKEYGAFYIAAAQFIQSDDILFPKLDEVLMGVVDAGAAFWFLNRLAGALHSGFWPLSYRQFDLFLFIDMAVAARHTNNPHEKMDFLNQARDYAKVAQARRRPVAVVTNPVETAL